MPAASVPADDPRGRLDLVLERSAEMFIRWGERRLAGLGLPINLWDGPEGAQELVRRICAERGIAGVNVLSPVHVAERAGLLQRRKGGRR